MYTALRLQKKLKPELRSGAVEIVVITPDPYMTYQPFLPEAAAGSISPRHVVAPAPRPAALRRDRRRGRLDRPRQADGHVHDAGQRQRGHGPRPCWPTTNFVLAPGSISRTPASSPASPTTASVSRRSRRPSACATRVIEQLDIASSTRDPAIRDAALTFVFVGGGYARASRRSANWEDMARYAAKYYRNVKAED